VVHALTLRICSAGARFVSACRCSEDYRWWWRSMLVPAASGVYLYAYCIFYYAANLDMPGEWWPPS